MDKKIKALGCNDIFLNIGVSRFSSPFCFSNLKSDVWQKIKNQ